MKKKWELIQQWESFSTFVSRGKKGVRVGSSVLRKGSMTVKQFSSKTARDFFNSFASTDETKNITDSTVDMTGSCVA